MNSSDLPIFTALGYGVFEPVSSTELRLLNPPVHWLTEFFGDYWDADNRILRVEDHSVIATYMMYCQSCLDDGGELKEKRITFEETFVEGRFFNGQVTSYLYEGNLILIIRKADDLDSVTRSEIQTLRKSALVRSNFVKAHSSQKKQVSFGGKNISESKLVQAIIRAVPCPFIILDRNQRLVVANELASKLFPGLSEERVSALDALAESTVTSSEANALFDKVKEGLNQTVTSRWEVHKPVARWLDVEVHPAMESGGKLAGSIWCFNELKNDVIFHRNRVGRWIGGGGTPRRWCGA